MKSFLTPVATTHSGPPAALWPVPDMLSASGPSNFWGLSLGAPPWKHRMNFRTTECQSLKKFLPVSEVEMERDVSGMKEQVHDRFKTRIQMG